MSTYKTTGFEVRRIETKFWVDAKTPEEASEKIRNGLASRVEHGKSILVEVGHGELEGPRVLGDLALTDEEYRVLEEVGDAEKDDPVIKVLAKKGFVKLDGSWPDITSRGLTALNFHRVNKARQEAMKQESTTQQVKKGARTARLVDAYIRNKQK